MGNPPFGVSSSGGGLTLISLLENSPRCSVLAHFTEEETEGQGGSESHQKGTGALGKYHQLKRVPLQLLLHIRSPLPCAAYSSPGPLVPPGPCSGGLGKQQLGALPPRLVVHVRRSTPTRLLGLDSCCA